MRLRTGGLLVGGQKLKPMAATSGALGSPLTPP